ncbi:IS200/IS605 family element RNA-guided endonuclease TnpB [Methanococcoides sp. AM1]|uniref:IS200/IS605 family element RNA-guided endonuclease TnpB n=1 Tax=Methanococcoides sp. AM1 TaxID=1201011 RepID=UPI001084844C|nr:IS200/IS605 family element RNA-guided endonuclease TnpB [Methanococcoides sp. AM1]
MLKAYKYRIYPNKNQKEIFDKHFGACRFIYNWGLNHKLVTYEKDKRSLSEFDINNMIPGLKKIHVWLNEVNSQSLQRSIGNMDSAFKKFFKEKTGFPKFKSRKNPVQSFQIPQHYTVNFDNNMIKLPKIKEPIKARLHRMFDGKMKIATVSKTTTGKYYISILVENGQEVPKKVDIDNVMGIDVGLNHFAILSNGEKIDNEKYLKMSIQYLQVLQQRLSRKQKGSNNWNKQKLQVAKLHEKIVNQRNDFQHKLSLRLISENQAIAIESLNIKGMVKNHCLAQAISDVSWGSFIEKLQYKADWYGKTVIQIGQFEPSSKLCHVCGYKNIGLKLHHRKWTCSDCNTVHDRDINAAINIKNIAFNTVGTTA